MMKLDLADLRLQSKLHGFKIEGDEDRVEEREAKELIADPLKDFPNDLDADLDATYTSNKVKEWKQYCSIKKGEITASELEYFWTEEREKAYWGEDKLARRCSINGKLWVLYTHLKSVGKHTVANLKSLVEEDITFSKFYPSFEDMEHYNEGREERLKVPDPREGLILDEHVIHMAGTGQLKELLSKLSQDGAVIFPEELVQHVNECRNT
jgi:hypothetical protein